MGPGSILGPSSILGPGSLLGSATTFGPGPLLWAQLHFRAWSHFRAWHPFGTRLHFRLWSRLGPVPPLGSLLGRVPQGELRAVRAEQHAVPRAAGPGPVEAQPALLAEGGAAGPVLGGGHLPDAVRAAQRLGHPAQGADQPAQELHGGATAERRPERGEPISAAPPLLPTNGRRGTRGRSQWGGGRRAGRGEREEEGGAAAMFVKGKGRG